jgi:hypothetical protein
MLWQQNSNPKENSGKTNTGISTEDTRWKSRPALVPGGASGKGPTPSIGEARDDQGKVWSALLARDFSSEKTPAGRNTRVRADEKKNEQRPPLRSRPDNETPFHQNRSRWQGNSWSRKISTEARTENQKQLLWLQHSKVSDLRHRKIDNTKELKVHFFIKAQASVQSINEGHLPPSFLIGIKTK